MIALQLIKEVHKLMTDCWEYDHSGCPYTNVEDCSRIDVCGYPIHICPIKKEQTMIVNQKEEKNNVT